MTKPKRVKIQRTPAVILMEEHWRKLGLDKGWKWANVIQLCQLTGLKENELGLMFGVPWGHMLNYRNQDKVPLTVTLHFLLFKNWWLERKLGVTSNPLIPVDKVVF